MLEKLGNAIKKVTDKISNAIFLDKNLVDTIVRELQRALIEADVNIHLVKELSEKLRKVAFDEKIKGIEKKEHLIKTLHDELVKILGEKKELKLKEKGQTKIMLVGLYASGKTTTVAKLGNYFQKRGKKAALVGLDVWRPAAKEQLMQLGKQHNIHVFTDLEEKDPIKIWERNKKKLEKYDLVIIDTAGRHDLDKELIDEIKNINKKIKPDETILVMPGDIGQAAKNQAEKFSSSLNITGVIISRMDSTAKGGGALTACAETKSGVYFITTGEKINDIEIFNPESFLSRLLGMGDLQALIEKVRSVTDENLQTKFEENIKEGKLTLDDVVGQVKGMNSMGGFDKLKSMVPGFGSAKIPEGALENQQKKIEKWEHILKSMNKEEKENPELIKKETSRIGRIARGAGVNTSEVRALLKQYNLLQTVVKDSSEFDMSKGINPRQLQKLMKKFGKKKMKF
ncbi:signal recognition particle protein [Candidatus Pacearchaeota archaeon CG10_big_fil_rev_8_21_14_0_10_32_42]|nr:MAG: signal recognition particle protein [Candidatus Pacearchaeota archaeon CG10_big_fil_rev_8_21_14_0_10_32_42]